MAIAFDRGFAEAELSGISAGQQRFAIVRSGPGIPASHLPSDIGAVTESSSAAQRSASRQPDQGSPNPRITSTEFGMPGLGSPDFDAELIKAAFACFEAHAPNAMEYFYARLLGVNPEIRHLFSLGMTDHREHLYAAMRGLIQHADSPAALTAYAGKLGAEHRKFGVKDKHCQAFFDALLATVRHASGSRWNGQTAAAFGAVFEICASAMRAAADADAQQQPAWWTGEVISHELRAPDIAVLRVRPDSPLLYRAGQYLSVQVPRHPRSWRSYSIATAPGPGEPLELHVRAVPGGTVSGSLVYDCQAGDTLLLGRAHGEMTAPPGPAHHLVCIAGGTGLAPIKAITGQVIAAAGAAAGPRITLYFGARTASELYDLPALTAMAAAYPGLTVIPVVSDELGFPGLTGLLPRVAAQRASCAGAEIYASGPDAMVAETVRLFSGRGAARPIQHDPLR